MAIFFFDVTDGAFIPDLVGTELENIDAARSRAVTLCGELLNSNEAKFWQGEEWLIEVRDDSGLGIFTLVFMARDTPIIRSLRPSKVVPFPAK